MQICSRTVIPVIAICFSLSHGSSQAASIGRATKEIQQEAVSIENSESRTWKSANGKFTLEGRLVSVDGNDIQIESKGKTIAAPLDKLCDADREFVESELERAQNAENPFMEVEEESPFKKVEPDSTRKADPSKLAIVPNWSRSKTVDLKSDRPIDEAAGLWTALPPEFRPFEIDTDSIHVRMNEGLITSDGSHFLASMTDPFGSERLAKNGVKPKNWLEIYRLPDGELETRIPVPEEHLVLCDFDPTTRLVLGYHDTFAPNKQVIVFELQGDSLVPRSSWQQMQPRSGGFRIDTARLLGEDRVLTVSNDQCVVWDSDVANALFSIPSSEDWQLSADRKFMLVRKNARKYEIDLASGKTTGATGSDSPGAAANVSPDGSLEATLKDHVVTIRKTKGAVQDEFYFPMRWPTAEVSWVDDQTLLIKLPFSDYYVDVPHRATILQVNRSSGGPAKASGFVSDRKSGGSGHGWIISPAPQAKSSLLAGSGLDLDAVRKRLPDPESMLLFQRGDRMAVEFDFQTEREMAQAAEKRVRAMLEDRGVIIDPSASDKLKVHTSERTEEVEYRNFGSPPWSTQGVDKVQVRNITRSIQLIRDGETVWSIHGGSGGASPILHLNEGETAQQAVDRQRGRPEGFWNNLSLPQHVAQHPRGQPWEIQH